MSHGEILSALIGLVGVVASTAAVLIGQSVSDSIKSLSHRVGNIEKALIERALIKSGP